MTYEQIYRRYSYLTTEELKQELSARSARRYSTRMVGADGCSTDAYVIQACKALLAERSESV